MIENLCRLWHQNKPFTSVSIGDVIELDDKLFRVEPVGFKSMTKDEFEAYKNIPRLKRLG